MSETKLCVTCGREMRPRKRWKDRWDEVRHCSAACRREARGRGRRQGEALEAAVLELLGERAAQATACPSEVARRLDPEGWRDLMEPVRRAARRLVAAGRVEVLQKGRVVDAATARGPIRLRLARP